jgi:hypothetical protein
LATPPSGARIRNANLQRLTQGLIGYGTSLAALNGAHNLGQVLATSVPTVPSYLAQKRATFDSIVAASVRPNILYL